MTQITSPHAHSALSTADVMRQVLLATIPGVFALTLYFGWGNLINILWASLTALACEAMVMKLRGRPVKYYLNDASALVTAVLLGIALPPFAPCWLVVFGSAFAILIVKQLYGGLGYNPFNPAMASYVILLISFPVYMSTWGTPSDLGTLPSFIDTFLWKLSSQTGAVSVIPDGYTMATPLDIVRQNMNGGGLSLSELATQTPQFGHWGGLGWEMVNAGFLFGGVYLMWRRIFTWHAPISMLISLAIMSLIFYDNGSSQSAGSPLFHLFSGATMFAAFFILTDPVSSAVSNRGRMIFGALIGVIIFIVRRWGNYPDAAAFAVLLLNFAAPFIDHYTQPRTYGHKGGDA
ncbi:MAG: electron transport complex subunit RsxD [Pseudomonadota bacterium]